MRFGGHETFHIREGWLHKGLRLLVEDPEKLVGDYAADWLGVGRNMAKSIRHWLVATGVAEIGEKVNGRVYFLRPTCLGELINKYDPYFLELGTWWVLHVNLVNSQEHAFTWSWFFNHFSFPRFDRAMCVDALSRNAQQALARQPRLKTLQRDIACLLSSYAVSLPREAVDPEEAMECPLAELDILKYFKASGQYVINQRAKEIPFKVFGYCAAKVFSVGATSQGRLEIPFRELATSPSGPGRCFALSNEALFDILIGYEREFGPRLEVINLAGERIVRLDLYSPEVWLKQYFKATAKRVAHAA